MAQSYLHRAPWSVRAAGSPRRTLRSSGEQEGKHLLRKVPIRMFLLGEVCSKFTVYTWWCCYRCNSIDSSTSHGKLSYIAQHNDVTCDTRADFGSTFSGVTDFNKCHNFKSTNVINAKHSEPNLKSVHPTDLHNTIEGLPLTTGFRGHRVTRDFIPPWIQRFSGRVEAKSEVHEVTSWSAVNHDQ